MSLATSRRRHILDSYDLVINSGRCFFCTRSFLFDSRLDYRETAALRPGSGALGSRLDADEGSVEPGPCGYGAPSSMIKRLVRGFFFGMSERISTFKSPKQRSPTSLNPCPPRGS
ncbi:Hypothetical predicted protein [Scomber scombrus]|uniref:Uncharacterized protein n=1 Tax=Scomber scombrus TaxID=13677 RepID=A0AAV1P0Z5_SCOSC